MCIRDREDIVEKVTQYAFNLIPYEMRDYKALAYKTLICQENYASFRRCMTPKILVDNEEINHH